MRLDGIAKMDILDLARSSTDINLLDELSKSNDMQVRRSVARNQKTPANILLNLLHDPVLNVCFMANQNPNCPKTRDFSNIDHPCVSCMKDEKHLNCVNCSTLNTYFDSSF